MPIAENINTALSYTPSTTDPPVAEGSRPTGMSLRKTCQNTDPPPEGRSWKQQPYLEGGRRQRLDSAGQLNVNPSRETWPGDDPPRSMVPHRASADPPLVEDRPPGKCMGEFFQVPDPPAEDKYHEPGSYFERLRRVKLDPSMRFNVNPSRVTWPGDDPPRSMVPHRASADPPFVADRPPGKCMRELFQVPDPPAEDKYHEPGSYFERLRRVKLDPSMRFNLNPSRETWPGDDPPRSMVPHRASADPPFVEDRPPGKYMGESFQVQDPPPDVEPPRTMATPSSSADPPYMRNSPHALACILIQFRSTRSP